MLKKLYCGTKNVAIYVCSSGKFPEYGKYACVKDLTNIMSGFQPHFGDMCIKDHLSLHILAKFIHASAVLFVFKGFLSVSFVSCVRLPA